MIISRYHNHEFRLQIKCLPHFCIWDGLFKNLRLRNGFFGWQLDAYMRVAARRATKLTFCLKRASRTFHLGSSISESSSSEPLPPLFSSSSTVFFPLHFFILFLFFLLRFEIMTIAISAVQQILLNYVVNWPATTKPTKVFNVVLNLTNKKKLYFISAT